MAHFFEFFLRFSKWDELRRWDSVRFGVRFSEISGFNEILCDFIRIQRFDLFLNSALPLIFLTEREGWVIQKKRMFVANILAWLLFFVKSKIPTDIYRSIFLLNHQVVWGSIRNSYRNSGNFPAVFQLTIYFSGHSRLSLTAWMLPFGLAGWSLRGIVSIL